MRLYLFLLFFFTICNASFLIAQEFDSLKTDPEPDIMIVHTPGIARPQKLKKKEQLRIELEGAEKPIIGTYTFLNDSSILVDNQEVKLSEIQKFRATNKTSFAIGTTLIICGTGLVATSLYLMKNLPGNDVGQVVSFVVGAGVGLAGGGCLVIGIIVASSSTRSYSMEKWHFYLRPQV